MEREFSKLRVLQSFRPNAATNPYLLQLVHALQEYATVETFSWRTAALGRYDVFHVHWPEVLLTGRTRLRTGARSILFFVVLVVARLRRRAIVRTVHNVEPHEGLDPSRRALVALCDRWTSGWITMTATVEVREPSALIPHGHYRDWYQVPSGVVPTAGQLLFFGNIRRYKGIDELLAVVSTCTRVPLSLRIVGRPQDPETTARIEDALARDERISTRLEYLEDADLALEIAASAVIVLPYRDMVNSGAALLALSLGRPVLVPSTESTRALQSEVGGSWVMTYTPPLSVDDVEASLDRVEDLLGVDRPDLSGREWDRAAREHLDLYFRAKLVAHR